MRPRLVVFVALSVAVLAAALTRAPDGALEQLRVDRSAAGPGGAGAAPRSVRHLGCRRWAASSRRGMSPRPSPRAASRWPRPTSLGTEPGSCRSPTTTIRCRRMGDPTGFPRIVMYELRPFQIVQTSNQVLILYMFEKRWRVIWTDGRTLPTNPDPRWYGYSVGRWVDDNTLVVDSRRDRRSDVARQRGQSAQQQSPRAGALSSRQSADAGADRHAGRPARVYETVDGARQADRST